MDGIDLGDTGDAQDVVNVEVGLQGLPALAYQVALVGLEAMQRQPILARVDGHGADVHISEAARITRIAISERLAIRTDLISRGNDILVLCITIPVFMNETSSGPEMPKRNQTGPKWGQAITAKWNQHRCTQTAQWLRLWIQP